MAYALLIIMASSAIAMAHACAGDVGAGIAIAVIGAAMGLGAIERGQENGKL